MDPPLISTAATTIPHNIIQQNYPESVESLSSPPPQPPPRSRVNETMNDDSFPNVPGGKLRLMCSYGGHIMPRPHDKSLCYVGGDTRIVVVDRSSSLRDLCSRLSRTILNGRPFTLKYQLPNEDLDNLITVTSDEDLDNMIEEYDRIASASSTMKPSSSRLRVFLFFTKPDTTLSMGSLLDDAKSETWFVDALNNSGILSRGVSDSAGDSFVNLDSVPASDSSNNLESQVESLTLLENNNNKVKNVLDNVNVVNSTPNSPMLENSLSSSSLTPSMENLPPIRVRVDENAGSRLQQENKVVMKQDGGFVVSSANVAMAAIPATSTMAFGGVVTATSGDVNVNRVVSDDERSDYGGLIGSRKPPLPLQLVQPRTSGGVSLPSPDSVTSDSSSIASTNSFSKIIYHQEQVQGTNIENKPQDSSYMLPPQSDPNQQLQQPPPQHQQQFVHPNTHYIHHPTSTNQVPITSYYQVYPPPSQQSQLHHPQQYPVYVMPIGSTQQPYNMTLQHNINDPNVVASSRPIIPQNGTPPIYPNKAPNPNVASNSTFVQVPSNQFQQQYVGMPQFHHQPQHPINVAPPSGTNYGYEYSGNVEGQVYYTQQQNNAPLVTQYQSMTPAAAAAALSDASQQFPGENVQQSNRTSQPV